MLSPAPARPRRGRPDRGPLVRVEVSGALVALALATLAVWHAAASSRAWVLLGDGDSVLPLLVRSSIESGRPQDWVLSAVLFVPETVLFLAIGVVVPDGRAALLVAAVVNLLLVYGALRVAARVLTRDGGRGVLAGLAGTGVLVLSTLLDSSSSWDAAELPSLIMTTTYYSATVIGILLAPTAVALALRGGHRSALPLAALALLSTWTNPLFVVWALAPLSIVGLLLVGRRLAPTRVVVTVAAWAFGGAGVGWILRAPFASHIALDATGYADPGRALHVLFGYYVRLTAERLASPEGALSFAILLGTTVLSAIAYARALRARDLDAAVLAGAGWVSGPVVLVLVTVLGVPAYRYLQPMVMMPLLGFVVLVARGRVRPNRSSLRIATVVALVTAVVAGCGITAAASVPDRSLDCVTRWVDASERTGAGRFMTIRGPKAYLRDPSRLIQVTKHFEGYAWLVNRDDFRTRRVSFVVSDDRLPGPVVPAAAADVNPSIVRCGRYTIADYHRPILPIGTPTSRYDP